MKVILLQDVKIRLCINIPPKRYYAQLFIFNTDFC